MKTPCDNQSGCAVKFENVGGKVNFAPIVVSSIRTKGWLTALGALTLTFLAVVPASAQTTASEVAASPFTSAALWAAAIAGFLGLVLGSIPPNDPDGGVKLDGIGALAWAAAAGGIAAGLMEKMTAGAWGVGLYTLGIGLGLALLRIILTRPPQVPKALDLQVGVNRAQGDTPAKKMKDAERMYKKASFHRGSYYATRSPRDFRYGATGAPARDLDLLKPGLAQANPNTFATLVVLVRELPDAPGEPAVIVAETSSAIVVSANGITVPGVGLMKAQTIAGMVGYAWR